MKTVIDELSPTLALRLYSCARDSDGGHIEDGFYLLIWSGSEADARETFAREAAREGYDYEPDYPIRIDDVTDKIPAEMHESEAGFERRTAVERLAGWQVPGDRQCERCELYEMDDTFPVCGECDRCEECGCTCDEEEDDDD